MSNDEQLRRPSGEEMRRFILNQLGENAAGLTQMQLLRLYIRSQPRWYSIAEQSRFLGEVAAMRQGGRIRTCHMSVDGHLVHQQTPHGWLAWVRGKQEEEEACAHNRGQTDVSCAREAT